MITAFQLIFSPFETWERITLAQRGVLSIICLHLVPLLVVGLGIEGYLLTRLGEARGELGYMIKVSNESALRYVIAYAVLILVGIVVGSKFLSLASQSFNVQTSYTQAFTVMAYGFGPIILARILDGFPQLNTWVCWAIGVAAAISVLYHGLGMVLRPDQTKGFGLYLMTIIILILVSGLIHFAAISVLHGKVFPPRGAHAAPAPLSYQAA